jgi:hypothetical protein
MNVTIELTEYVNDDKLIELRRIIRAAFDEADLDTNSITISCALPPTALNALPDLHLHTIATANLSGDEVGLRIQKDAKLLLQCSLGAAEYLGTDSLGTTYWKHPQGDVFVWQTGEALFATTDGQSQWLR